MTLSTTSASCTRITSYASVVAIAVLIAGCTSSTPTSDYLIPADATRGSPHVEVNGSFNETRWEGAQSTLNNISVSGDLLPGSYVSGALIVTDSAGRSSRATNVTLDAGVFSLTAASASSSDAGGASPSATTFGTQIAGANAEFEGRVHLTAKSNQAPVTITADAAFLHDSGRLTISATQTDLRPYAHSTLVLGAPTMRITIFGGTGNATIETRDMSFPTGIDISDGNVTMRAERIQTAATATQVWRGQEALLPCVLQADPVLVTPIAAVGRGAAEVRVQVLGPGSAVGARPVEVPEQGWTLNAGFFQADQAITNPIDTMSITGQDLATGHTFRVPITIQNQAGTSTTLHIRIDAGNCASLTVPLAVSPK